MAKVKAVNPIARLFRSVRALRDPFYRGQKWSFHGAPSIFCSAAYPSPFKGLHVAIRALAILKKHIPDIKLRVAGAHQQPGLRRERLYRLGKPRDRSFGGREKCDVAGSLIGSATCR